MAAAPVKTIVIWNMVVYLYTLKKVKGCIPKRNHACTNEQELAILLLWAGLVEVGELGFFGKAHLCPVCLIVEGQCSVGILEIVSRFIFCSAIQSRSSVPSCCHFA